MRFPFRVPSIAGRLFRPLALVMAAWLLTGCESARYLDQAVRGQVQIWRKEKPISKLVQDPKTDPELRRRLELVLAYRKFAVEELGLRSGRSYLAYADLERPFVSWTVSAAPEFSLEPHEWWFPVVGSVSYRGYFREEMARAYAGKMAEQGMDVAIGGVSAYSTLGWFADPVLNTFLFDPEDELADLIFHELTHRRLYVAGDTDFNEAFAMFVAQEGLRRWFRKHPNPKAEAAWRLKEERWAEFRTAVLATQSRLKSLYGSAPTVEAAELRRRKEAEIDALKRRLAGFQREWKGNPDLTGWLDHPINNARLNSIATYYRWVPAFGVLLGDCNGDLQRFYGEVEELGNLRKPQRQRRLLELLARAHPPN